MKTQHRGFVRGKGSTVVWPKLLQGESDEILTQKSLLKLNELLKGSHFEMPIEIDRLGLLAMSPMLPRLEVIGDGVVIWDTRLEIADEHFSVFSLRKEGFYLVNRSATAMFEVQILDQGEAIELHLLSEGRIFPSITLLAKK